jgi:hypothetical protein
VTAGVLSIADTGTEGAEVACFGWLADLGEQSARSTRAVARRRAQRPSVVSPYWATARRAYSSARTGLSPSHASVVAV